MPELGNRPGSGSAPAPQLADPGRGQRARAAQFVTQRLRLSQVTEQELAEFHRLHTEPAGYRLDPAQMHPDEQHSLSRIAEIADDWQRDGLGYLTVTDRVSGRYLGVAGVRRSGHYDVRGRYRSEDSWNLYYRFFSAAWGHGYCIEAVTEAVRACAALDPVAIVRARIATSNVASERVASRLGLRFSHQEVGVDATEFSVYECSALELRDAVRPVGAGAQSPIHPSTRSASARRD